MNTAPQFATWIPAFAPNAIGINQSVRGINPKPVDGEFFYSPIRNVFARFESGKWIEYRAVGEFKLELSDPED